MKGRLAVGAAAVVAAIVFTVSNGNADPNLLTVPAHRHWIQTPTGEYVEVGPNVCDNPNLQRAFNQFHNNVHRVTGSGIGPAAPGLHNGFGAELSASLCDVTP
jgi:hypothetical protein